MALDSLRIGKIWGISISLHWTFVVLLLLFLLFYPLRIFAVILLLFVCVFIHEGAHAYTALRNKMKVNGILLTPLGGATMIDDVNLDYRKEFNISISGPMMSIFLGGIFGVLAVLAPPGSLVFIFQETFILNMALGVLNLLPAFPLDGGRVFRSYLERKHNRFNATMTTVKLSKILAVVSIFASLIYLYYLNASLDYKALDFVIFLILAAILYGGAQAERQATFLRRDTKGLTIDKAISKDFVLVSPNARVSGIYKLVEGRGVSTVLTSMNGEIMLLDLFRKRQPDASLASELTIAMPQFKPGMEIMDAMQRLESGGRGIAAVVRNKKPVGIVTIQRLNSLISLRMLSRKPRD